MQVWQAQALSYLLAVVINYTLLRFWTFALHSTESQTHKESMAKYAMLIIVNLPLTTALIIAIEYFGVAPFIAKLIVVAAAACWNFVVYDKIIFRPKDSPSNV